MSDNADTSGQAVNDATPTNAPGRTPADNDLSPKPGDWDDAVGTDQGTKAPPRKEEGDDQAGRPQR